MKKADDTAGKNSRLRRQAEERLNATGPETAHPLTGEEVQRLYHELQVHQIELEMQNAELRQSRNEVEEALEKYTDLYDFAPVGYFTLALDTRIHAVNLAGAGLLFGAFPPHRPALRAVRRRRLPALPHRFPRQGLCG